jgi:hypothetical protein
VKIISKCKLERRKRNRIESSSRKDRGRNWGYVWRRKLKRIGNASE